jgi:hypothetical protein
VQQGSRRHTLRQRPLEPGEVIASRRFPQSGGPLLRREGRHAVGLQLSVDMLVDRAPGGGQRFGEMLGAAVGLRRDVEQALAGAERPEGPARTLRRESIGEPGSGLELRELPRARWSVAHPDGEAVGGHRLEDRRLEAPPGGGADGIRRDDPDKLNRRILSGPDKHGGHRRREALQGEDDLGQGEITERSCAGRAAEAQIEAFRS